MSAIALAGCTEAPGDAPTVSAAYGPAANAQSEAGPSERSEGTREEPQRVYTVLEFDLWLQQLAARLVPVKSQFCTLRPVLGEVSGLLEYSRSSSIEKDAYETDEEYWARVSNAILGAITDSLDAWNPGSTRVRVEMGDWDALPYAAALHELYLGDDAAPPDPLFMPVVRNYNPGSRSLTLGMDSRLDGVFVDGLPLARNTVRSAAEGGTLVALIAGSRPGSVHDSLHTRLALRASQYISVIPFAHIQPERARELDVLNADLSFEIDLVITPPEPLDYGEYAGAYPCNLPLLRPRPNYGRVLIGGQPPHPLTISG